MDNEMRFSVVTKVMDLYDFLLNHMYRSFRGLIGIGISIAALVLLINGGGQGDNFRIVMLVIIAALFTVIQPIQLFMKAAQRVKLNADAEVPLFYVVNKEGIHVKQKEEEMTLPWENVVKIKRTPRSLLIYSSSIHAFIIPKSVLGDDYQKLCNIVVQCAPKNACKMKAK